MKVESMVQREEKGWFTPSISRPRSTDVTARIMVHSSRANGLGDRRASDGWYIFPRLQMAQARASRI